MPGTVCDPGKAVLGGGPYSLRQLRLEVGSPTTHKNKARVLRMRYAASTQINVNPNKTPSYKHAR